MRPTKGDLYVDRPLTVASIRRINDDTTYIAGRVFPNVPVEVPAASFQRWERGSFLRSQMRVRAPGAETVGARFGTERGPFYSVRVWGLHKDNDDQTMAVGAASDWDLAKATVEFLTQQGLLLREREWARNFFIPGVWGTDLTGVTSTTPSAGQFTQWDNAASDPIKVVRRYRTLMLQMTGYTPNTLVVGPWVLDALMEHPDIMDRAVATGAASVDEALLAALFGVQQVVVPQAVENVSVDGVTEDIQFIMGNHALLCYAAPVANLASPSAGYTLSWTGYVGAGNNGQRIKRFRIEERASDRIEIEMAFDQQVLAPELGIFFGDAIGAVV
jgi:hypothetical protein